MVKKIFASPKVLPTLLECSLKHKAKIIESALSRIYNFAIFILAKKRNKSVLKENEDYLYLLNSLKALNLYAKKNSKKRNIYERWNNLRLSLVDIFNAKNNTKIKYFKKIKKISKIN